MSGFDLSHIVVSVAAALVIGGAVLVYVRSRLGELERSHIEQARVLRTFIAQQALALQPGEAPTGEVASAPSPVIGAPHQRIMVSDEESGSDDSSEYESDTLSDCSIQELDGEDDLPAESDPLETRVVELAPSPTGIANVEVSVPEELDYHKMKVEPLRALAVERGLVEGADAVKKMKKAAVVALLVGEGEVNKEG